jgi:hypothetical protein
MENLKQCEKKRGKNLRGKKVQGKPVPKGGAKKVKTGHTFQPGNKLWQLREFPGRPPTFETPEQFWDECVKYFQWVEDNPLWEEKAFVVKGELVKEKMYKTRAMTMAGLCTFLGISIATYNHMKKNRADFSKVFAAVEQTFYEQKFTGAAADLLNASIIARELGLADRREVDNPDGNLGTKVAVVLPYAPGSLTMDEWQKIYDEMAKNRRPLSELDEIGD